MSDPIYILASGQSNMIGGGHQNDTAVNPDVEFWNPDTKAWEVAHISSDHATSTGLQTGGSIAWSAAKELQEQTGRTVRIIVDAKGGIAIDDWLLTGDRTSTGDRYRSLQDQYEAAGSPRIDMFVFAQGESNAAGLRSDINTFEEYSQALLNFTEQLRADGIIGYGTSVIMPELVELEGASFMHHRNDVISHLDEDRNPFTWTAYSDMGNVSQVAGGTTGNAVHWNLDGLQYMGQSVIDAFNRYHADDSGKMVMSSTEASSYASREVVNYSNSSAAIAINLIAGTGAAGNAQGDRLASDTDVVGSRKDDFLKGSGMSNWLSGHNGDDRILGMAGDDVISGGKGNDALNGGGGSDQIIGGDGNDILVGGAQDDHLSGGTGADKFVFRIHQGTDMVHDFEPERDVIDLVGHNRFSGMSFDQFRTFLFEDDGNTMLSPTRAYKDGDTIILAGITMDQLGADDFLL